MQIYLAHCVKQVHLSRVYPNDDLIESAHLISNFRTYWNACDKVGQPEIARQQLVSKIVERVFVHQDKMVAPVLYGDFGVVLAENEIASAMIAKAIEENVLSVGLTTLENSHCGSDGL